MKVLLDTGVLGFVTHPKATANASCLQWMRSLISANVQIVIPEICDYELRREYLFTNNLVSVQRLDALIDTVEFKRVDSAIWKSAAACWARCKQTGRPHAPDAALDGDVILIATTLSIQTDEPVVVATTNVKHLCDFVDARNWESVTPP